MAAVRGALDDGITFFDTAQAYGFGASEEILRRGARGRDRRRDDVIVATKGGLRPDGDDLERDSTPEFLREGVEESLGHLGVEAIDLYQVHWPDSHHPVRGDRRGALQQLERRGQDPPRRRVELQPGRDGAALADRRGRDGPAALQPVQPRDRGGRAALVPRAGHRRARLRTALPRAAERPLRPVVAGRGRLAARPRALRGRRAGAQPGGGRAAEGVRRGARAHARRSWRWRGCSRSRACTWRSPARAGPPTSRASRPRPRSS